MVNDAILVYNTLLAIWIIWVLYWIASWVYESSRGTRNKIVKGQRDPLQSILLVLSLILVLLPGTDQLGILTLRFIPIVPALWCIGLLITALGIFFAIWARYHLGSNWSSIPSVRKDQLLVRTGPYSIVRHPIYTGILFGMIGSAIVVGQYRSIIAIILIIIFCWLRIREEEKLMTGEFGKQYDTYKKEIKTIIPFIL